MSAAFSRASRLLLGLFLFFMLTAGVCEMTFEKSQPVKFADIVGTYEARHDSALVDRLVLSADSTYVHVFKSLDGKVFNDSGSYNFFYGTDTRYAYVHFQQFLHRFARRVPGSSPGYMYPDTVPETWATSFFKYKSGRLSIRRADLEESYYKVDSLERNVSAE